MGTIGFVSSSSWDSKIFDEMEFLQCTSSHFHIRSNTVLLWSTVFPEQFSISLKLCVLCSALLFLFRNSFSFLLFHLFEMVMAARGSRESNRRLTHYGAPLWELAQGRVPSLPCIPEISAVLLQCYRVVLLYCVEIHHRQEKIHLLENVQRVSCPESPQPANSLSNTGYYYTTI